MLPRRRSWWRALQILVLAGAPAHVLAQPVELVYRAPPDCPASGDFVARVRARAPGADLQVGGEAARRLLVVIDRGPASFTGRLTVVDEDAQSDDRRHSSPTCAELVDALVLTAALTFPPETDTAPPEAAVAAGQGVPAPGAQEGPASAWLLGIELGAATPLDGRPLGAASVIVERSGTRRTRGLSWPPALRLAIGHARNDVTGGAGAVQAALWRARLDVCAPGVESATRLFVDLCAVAEGGFLSVGGVKSDVLVTPGPTVREPWMLGGSALRAGWITARLRIEVQVGLGFPIMRTRFEVDPSDVLITRVRGISWSGAAGIAMRFP